MNRISIELLAQKLFETNVHLPEIANLELNAADVKPVFNRLREGGM